MNWPSIILSDLDGDGQEDATAPVAPPARTSGTGGGAGGPGTTTSP